jgi:hypothetical protein
MEKRIFKYTLQIEDKQVINLPKGAEFLTVQTQFNELQLWALVDQNEIDQEERYIEIFGTGHPVYYDMGVDRKYLATCQLDDGNFVFHVFERLS